jgi:hypothetical protein
MSHKDGKGELKFGTEVTLLLSQQSATRVMLADERVMRGMTDVVKCQVEFSQELMQHGLDAMHPGPNAGRLADFTSAHIGLHQKRMKHNTTAAMNKAVRAMAVCFGETTRLMFKNGSIESNSNAPIADKAENVLGPRTTSISLFITANMNDKFHEQAASLVAGASPT